MIHVFEIKSRSEYWIFFKFIKLFAIYIGTYLGLMITIFGLGGRRRGGEAFDPEYTKTMMDLVFYGSIAAVLYYVIRKLRSPEIEKFEFNDSIGKLRVSYRNFFTHYRWKKLFYYSDLSYKYERSNDFIAGEYDHIWIYAGKSRIALIHGASTDWHKLPQTTMRLVKLLATIRNQIHGTNEIVSSHLPPYTIE
jgi:hypothetical protein